MSDMQSLRPLLERLLERRDLAESESASILVALTNPETPPALAGALLAAMRAKGVSGTELRGSTSSARAAMPRAA
jgi:anthranilate phosphoribosyltransferase